MVSINHEMRRFLSHLTIFVVIIGEREQSLEEISLRLINSIMLEKSDLEQQCAEVKE